MTTPQWSIGSRWQRWDPHLHAPGTLRNDQFGNDWDTYVKRIEDARPIVSALGITDYYTLRGYKEVLLRRQAGALKSVPLVFPNVEIRLTIETAEHRGINLHLLVCPDDKDHVLLVEEKIAQLTFRYRDDVFPCTEEGLRRLGRAHRQDQDLPDEAAMREGANQFKIELSAIRQLVEQDPWMKKNVLVAVAGGKDGLAGIAKDASFRAQREELGRFAHVVFSGQPSDRSYWLGQHTDFLDNGQTPKPCLHGSDAHAMAAVLEPAQGRLCWIRGEATFDGLRQALVEPERRVFIGELPPPGPNDSDTIQSLQIENAAWIRNREISLNSGLVTIIGAKGSGKTALADLIAFACGAVELEPGPASFIDKAGQLLNGLELELVWGDGARSVAALPRGDSGQEEPRVRYLSQQFVERLCAREALAEPLIDEIERVVFSGLAEEDRLECVSYDELLNVVLENPTAERRAERHAIRSKTRLVAEEMKLQESMRGLVVQVEQAERERKSIEKNLLALPTMASDEKTKLHSAAMLRLHGLKSAIAAEERRAHELGDVEAEVRRQIKTAQMALYELKEKHPTVLEPEFWDSLVLRVETGALERLSSLERESRARIRVLRENGLPSEHGEVNGISGLEALIGESDRLAKELGLDEANAKRRSELERQLPIAVLNEEKARQAVAHAEKAQVRRKTLQAERLDHYERVFATLVEEEEALRRLYEPLRQRIAEDPRLSKLEFVVQRHVKIGQWASRGESLLDLRKPPFNGRGMVEDAARSQLLPAWKAGQPQEARFAMDQFITDYGGAAVSAMAQGRSHLDFGEWLFSTEHISVRYGIRYEGVEIANLSPGARGVVLLTLYLGLDKWDQRPLIIDQPEENLDPRSVYADLVPFFRDAARRRQIIMVTHNANLVVNTDSDQVIVAEAVRTSPTALPQIYYEAGGLEDLAIRSHVCRLLEGGVEAFRRRGQRYGVGS